MHRVVRVLVEEAEGGVIDAAAAEIAKIVQAQDLSHVVAGRVMIVDDGVDRAAPGIFRRIAQRVPQRVGRKQRIDHALTVLIGRRRGHVGIANRADHVAEEIVLRDEVGRILCQLAKGVRLFSRRLGVELADEPVSLLGRKKRLESLRNNPAAGRIPWPVLRHGPIPIRHHDVAVEVLKVLFELVEIRAVPGQEPLPPVLAVILVDQRLVIVVAAILDLIVEIVNRAESPPQIGEFGLAQTIEILPLARFSVTVGILPGSRCEGRKLGDLGQPHPRHFAVLGVESADVEGQQLVVRAAVVYPVRDEGDVVHRDAFAAPWQRREP